MVLGETRLVNVVVLSCLCNRCPSFGLVWGAYYTIYSLLSTYIHILLHSTRTQCFSHKVPNHQVGDQGSNWIFNGHHIISFMLEIYFSQEVGYCGFSLSHILPLVFCEFALRQ